MSADNDQDYTLETLVSLVNGFQDDSGGPWLVLTTGGLIVSGQLIPNWLWFESYEKEISAKEEGNAWSFFFSSYKDLLREDKESQKKADAAAESLPPLYREAISNAIPHTGFIHLREAKVFHPGQSPLPTNGMRWRGKLTDISGWSFGRLGGS